MSNEALKARLAKIIEDIIGAPVDADELLIESGSVNSLTAVDIVLAVKEQFGCKIPPTEIEEHLESLNALVDYVAKHQSA